MTRLANFLFRMAAFVIMIVLIVFNQRVDAIIVGLLALMATVRYD